MSRLEMLRDLRSDHLYARADPLCGLLGFEYCSTNVYHKLLILLSLSHSHGGALQRQRGGDQLRLESSDSSGHEPTAS